MRAISVPVVRRTPLRPLSSVVTAYARTSIRPVRFSSTRSLRDRAIVSVRDAPGASVKLRWPSRRSRRSALTFERGLGRLKIVTFPAQRLVWRGQATVTSMIDGRRSRGLVRPSCGLPDDEGSSAPGVAASSGVAWSPVGAA